MSPYDVNTGAWLGDEPAGTEERTDLAADGAAQADPYEGVVDPRQTSKEVFDARMAQGMTREDAASESFAVLARAALAGDRRVIVDDTGSWRNEPRFVPGQPQ